MGVKGKEPEGSGNVNDDDDKEEEEEEAAATGTPVSELKRRPLCVSPVAVRSRI